MQINIDAQEQTESETYPTPNRCSQAASLERLFYRVRATYPQPHTIEGRSQLTVADVLAGHVR
ncbi:MAG: hypothetical protein WBA46_00210 [Thermomicrobiales bacterium]